MIQQSGYRAEIVESERLLVFVHFEIVQHPNIHKFKPNYKLIQTKLQSISILAPLNINNPKKSCKILPKSIEIHQKSTIICENSLKIL